MKKPVSFFVLFVILCFAVSSSVVLVNAQVSWVEWNRTYEGTDVHTIVETSDGGYAVCGRTYVTDPQGDFLLIKIDGLGNVEWNQTYGGTDYEQAHAMIITSDGGYALTGPTSSFGSGNRDFWLIKIDDLGNVEWNQTYGETRPEVPYSLVQTSDGGYALVGVRHKVDGSDCWMVKADSSGNMEWNKTLSGRDVDRAFSVIETSDGRLVVLSKEYTRDARYAYASLTKIDSLGNIEWKQSYEGPFGNNGFQLIKTSDDKFAFACLNYLFGNGHADFWLVKMDLSGNVELNKTYGGPDEDIAYSLVETSDGGFALAGSTKSFGHGNTDFWLVKTDDSGEMEWNRFYGSSEHEICHSLVQSSDGGYVLVGSQLIWGTGEESIWIIRTNIQGVPEFPSWFILPFLLVATLVVTVARNKLIRKKLE